MGGKGKHRWKFSIYNRSSSIKSENKDPPVEFVCPISGSLMFDPVIVSSGQTFDRTSIQVCRDLGISPNLSDGLKPDFSTLIPNLALKKTILNWCDASGAEHPPAPDYYSVESTVRTAMASSSGDSEIRASETELLRGLAEKPNVMMSHAVTELNPRANRFYSSSSEESARANFPATPLLPFTTRPSCFSPTSSPTSNSFDCVSDDTLNPVSGAEDEEFVVKLKSLDVLEQEQGVIALRSLTRTNEKARVSLCTPRLLSALRSLLISRYAAVQTNAAAALVNLSLEKVNKVKIVRSGIVILLIDLLISGFAESQEHAAGALFSLALEDDNKTAIGVLGALQPLLHALRSESERTRNDSALALYNLSLVQSNRVKLLKLGAVSTLLAILSCGESVGKVLLVLSNLASCAEGRSVMLDSNAVECLVQMLRNSLPESTQENCVAALYSLSHGNLRFKGLAREARAVEVLRGVAEGGTERAREKAKRMLVMLRGRDEEEEEEVDWEGMLEGRVSRTRYPVGRNVHGANSTEF